MAPATEMRPITSKPLILASASPRRREILGALGVQFEVVATDVEELREGTPEDVVLENALRKARAAATDAAEGALVLGFDTDVALEGRLLGKPVDEADARERLEALSGRTHEVWSGVAVIEGGEEQDRRPSARSSPSARSNWPTWIAIWRPESGATGPARTRSRGSDRP